MRYLVADCGGGTVDLTVHELEESNKLKELYKATGGAWGSMGVDCQFELLLVDIFGQDFLVDFVKTKPASWLELVSTFEAKKRVFNSKKQVATNISLPFAFIEYHRERTGKSVETAVLAYDDEGIQWSSQGMLRIQSEIMMSFFEPVTATIVHHIQQLLAMPELLDIRYLFLVGGFAESPVLQEAVQNAFRSQLRVIIPQDVSLTILKGAVMFGQDPTLVHIRRSILTYGVGCLNIFIPGKHPPEKLVLKDGQEWCDEVFDTFVFSDQAISLGHTITRSYTAAHANKQSTKISLFASENETVHFVTDPGCTKVGELRLDVTNSSNIVGETYRELRVSMMFGNTEISVEAVDCASGQIAKAVIDFLNK